MNNRFKQMGLSIASLALALSLMTPGTTEAASMSLPLNGTVTGALTADAPVQTYELALNEAGEMTFDLTSSIESYGSYELVDAYDRVVFSTYIQASANNPGRKVYDYDLEKGMYQLKVYDDSGNDDVGSFRIQTTFQAANTNDIEPNNGTAEAQWLTHGSKTKGYLSVQDPVDMYGVKLTRAGRLTIDLSSYVDGYTSIELVDDYNRQVFGAYTVGAENNPAKLVRAIDLEAGRYYVRVFDDSGSDDTGVYELKASFLPAYNQEVEPNNGSAEARIFPFYKRQTGFLSWNDSVDVYKVVVAKASKVGFDMTSYVSTYTNVALYDTQNDSVFATYFTGSSKQPGRFKKTVVLSRGTYYFHVYDDSGSDDTGKYQLMVTSSHLLPAVTVNQVTVRSTKVTGKTENGAKVTMTIGKRSYSRTADSKGNYSFKVNKQKVGTSIKITSKNKYGSSVKTVKVSK